MQLGIYGLLDSCLCGKRSAYVYLSISAVEMCANVCGVDVEMSLVPASSFSKHVETTAAVCIGLILGVCFQNPPHLNFALNFRISNLSFRFQSETLGILSAEI